MSETCHTTDEGLLMQIIGVRDGNMAFAESIPPPPNCYPSQQQKNSFVSVSDKCHPLGVQKSFSDESTISGGSSTYLTRAESQQDIGRSESSFDETQNLLASDAAACLVIAEKGNGIGEVVSGLIAVLQGVEVLCGLSILYIFKDDYGLDPGRVSLLMTVIRIPWIVKPFWAIISDSVPLFGNHRRSYVQLGSFICVMSCFALGLTASWNCISTTLLLLTYFSGSAICNVIGEALVVAASRDAKGRDGAATTVSRFFAFRNLSFAVMSYLSGYMLHIMSKRHIFLFASVIPLAVFIASLSLPVADSFGDSDSVPYKVKLSAQCHSIWRVVRVPQFVCTAGFIFLLMATPSSGAAMFYFLTNELHLEAEVLGRLALFRSLASLTGVGVYALFFKRSNIHSLLLWSTILITPFCYLPIILVKRWNVIMGVSDVFFLIGDSVFMEFVGLGVASLISAVLTSALSVTAHNFNNLSALILICASTNLLPLGLLWLLPQDEIALTESKSRSDENWTSAWSIKRLAKAYTRGQPKSNDAESSL